MKLPPRQTEPNRRDTVGALSQRPEVHRRKPLGETDTGDLQRAPVKCKIISPVAGKLVDLPFLPCPYSLDSLLLWSALRAPSLPASQWRPQLNGSRLIHARPKQANHKPFFLRNLELRHKDSSSLALKVQRVLESCEIPQLCLYIFWPGAEGYLSFRSLIFRMSMIQKIRSIGCFLTIISNEPKIGRPWITK